MRRRISECVFCFHSPNPAQGLRGWTSKVKPGVRVGLICSLAHLGILLRAAEGRRTPGRWRLFWSSSMMTVAVRCERSVLPHPYPLPLAERTVHGKVETFEIFSSQRRSHFTGDSRAILPLPAGEGKGEGESSILFTATALLKPLEWLSESQSVPECVSPLACFDTGPNSDRA